MRVAISSNSFGKAPSSVKIKGTGGAVYRRGGFGEEEATCVQSYHLTGTRELTRDISLSLPNDDYILRL